jgi:hypothetical protein
MTQGVAWTVEDHFRDKPEHIRSLYEVFERAIAACGPYQTSVTKTAISFKGSVRGFAGATPRAKSLTGFLDLQEQVHGPPFTRVTPYTSRLWVHRFVIKKADELDDRFVALVQAAYEVGQGAHRS